MSSTIIDPGLTVNDVVRLQPETLGIFRSFGIDTCCGGGLPIGEVCRRHDIPLEDLSAALAPLVSEPAA